MAENTQGEGPAAPTMPGWTAVRLLATGGQAEVWLVRGEDGGEAVLKVAATGQDPGAVAAEADAYRHLSHPHLLRVLGRVSTDRGEGVLSERLPAGSLASLVRAAGPLTPGQAVTVLVPVAQALAHLHEHGVVHGDVSPSNVLFGLEGRPALCDLGVARVVGGQQGVGGTPGFTAPERRVEGGDQAPGHGGAAADVYGWGALGWFALTGRAPGEHLHRAPLPVLVPGVPLDLARVLEAALDPDPARRPEVLTAAQAVYAAVPPEPVPLHEGAPQEVAHLLPTAVPRPSARRRRRSPVRGEGGPGGGGGRVAGRSGGARAVGAAVALTAVGAAFWVLVTGAGAADDPGGTPVAATSPAAAEGGPAGAREPVGSATRPRATGTGPHGPAPGGEGGEDGSEPAASLQPAPVPDAEALAAALEGIGRARTAALTDPATGPLEAYAARDSPAWDVDRAIQAGLSRGGGRFAGLEARVRATGAAVGGPDGRVGVPAVVELSDHRLLGADGTVLREESATSEEVTVVLVTGEEGRWVLYEVVPR